MIRQPKCCKGIGVPPQKGFSRTEVSALHPQKGRATGPFGLCRGSVPRQQRLQFVEVNGFGQLHVDAGVTAGEPGFRRCPAAPHAESQRPATRPKSVSPHWNCRKNCGKVFGATLNRAGFWHRPAQARAACGLPSFRMEFVNLVAKKAPGLLVYCGSIHRRGGSLADQRRHLPESRPRAD